MNHQRRERLRDCHTARNRSNQISNDGIYYHSRTELLWAYKSRNEGHAITHQAQEFPNRGSFRSASRFPAPSNANSRQSPTFLPGFYRAVVVNPCSGIVGGNIFCRGGRSTKSSTVITMAHAMTPAINPRWWWRLSGFWTGLFSSNARWK